MISADMDVLLAGGQGSGIHSPEMIEEEKLSWAEKGAPEAMEEGAEACASSASGDDTPEPSAAGSDGEATQSVDSGTIKKSKRKAKASGKKFAGAPKGRGSFK